MKQSVNKLTEQMVSFEPILMTVTADEFINRRERYPALSSKVEIAFVVLDPTVLVPKFVYER